MTLAGKIVALVVGLTAALLAGVWALLSGSWSAWSSDAVEHELVERAASLAAQVEVEHHGRIELEGDAAALRDPSHPWRVMGPAGVVLGAGELPWPAPDQEHPGRAGGLVQDAQGRTWRVVARAFTGKGEHHERGPLLIQVAGVAAPYQGLEQRFRHGLLLAVGMALVAAGLGATVLAHLSLSPLRRLAAQVDAIGASSLDRRLATGGLEPELRRVATAFNSLLGRLDEAMQQQRQLISRASHALRTPVATILTRAEVELRRERDAASYREALADVAAAAQESAALVAHLLTLARLGERRVTSRLEQVLLSEVAREVEQLMAPRALDAGVALEVAAPDGFAAWAERSALRELLEALLDNALRYTPSGGRAGLRAAPSPGGCLLVVWDTGPGIRAEERGRVFDRFYRGSAAQASGAPGSGLGLAIVKAIVDSLRGSVTLADRAGGGLEVTIVLPGKPGET